MAVQGFVQGLSKQEIEAEFVAVYDAGLGCLKTGQNEKAFARSLAERGLLQEMPIERFIVGFLTFRDILERSLVRQYRVNGRKLEEALDLYELRVSRVIALVALALAEKVSKVLSRTEQLQAQKSRLIRQYVKSIKKKTAQLQALVEAGMILAAELSLESVLQKIADAACKLLGARYGALGVLDEQGRLGQFITTGVDEKTKEAIGPAPVGKGILGVAARETKPLRLKDLTKDPRAHGFPPGHPPMKSFLGVPIISKGKILGTLYLTEKQGVEELSGEDEALAVTLAAQAAIAIENASLYEELRRSYQELRRSQDLLIRQEKLASLGRLAAGLAHEMNNPLASIAGFAQALERRSAAEQLLALEEFQDFPRFLQMIEKEAERAAAIVRRLLDFARQREPCFEVIDLRKVIVETVALVDRQATLANKRVMVEPFSRPMVVKADPQMLQQVFLNLLTNALDAIEGGGEVWISANVEAGGDIEIFVADTGCGIPLEHLPRIFDPFFTTKEVGRGTGLGLAICQSIVEQHGGAIEVKSEGRDLGTTVIVRLPSAMSETGMA